MKLKNVYTQSADKPDRFTLVGQHDLPNKLSNRAVSNLPFSRWGLGIHDILSVQMVMVENQQSLVINIKPKAEVVKIGK